MKKLKTLILLIAVLLFTEAKINAQEIAKYDYLEVIVIQKPNNAGKIKRIRVEEQSSLKEKVITVKKIEKQKTTSDLLNYMNTNNWEFVDRKAITEINNPVWMSYLFRKQK